MLSQLRLMNFIRRIGRDEIYIKYVHQLVNVSCNSHTKFPEVNALKDASPISELCRGRAHFEITL